MAKDAFCALGRRAMGSGEVEQEKLWASPMAFCGLQEEVRVRVWFREESLQAPWPSSGSEKKDSWGTPDKINKNFFKKTINKIVNKKNKIKIKRNSKNNLKIF